jgi:hypothetical protein
VLDLNVPDDVMVIGTVEPVAGVNPSIRCPSTATSVAQLETNALPIKRWPSSPSVGSLAGQRGRMSHLHQAETALRMCQYIFIVFMIRQHLSAACW